MRNTGENLYIISYIDRPRHLSDRLRSLRHCPRRERSDPGCLAIEARTSRAAGSRTSRAALTREAGKLVPKSVRFLIARDSALRQPRAVPDPISLCTVFCARWRWKSESERSGRFPCWEPARETAQESTYSQKAEKRCLLVPSEMSRERLRNQKSVVDTS